VPTSLYLVLPVQTKISHTKHFSLHRYCTFGEEIIISLPFIKMLRHPQILFKHKAISHGTAK
jgi:hypothetical protein